MSDETPLNSREPLPIDPKHRPRSSITLGKLAGALAKAQGEMQNAEKDNKGNFGKYATLASTWDAIREALSKNEIAIYQRPLTVAGVLKMCTMIIHSSGEFLDDSELEMIFDRTGGRITPMQAMGSAVTYARRYTLQAATGIAPADDDDGANAGKPAEQKQTSPPAQPKNQSPNMIKTAAQATQAVQNLKKPTNSAPATEEMIATIHSYCIDRDINEGCINKLIIDGYGYTTGKIPIWVADELIDLLSNPECNAAVVMAEVIRVQRRRDEAEAKRKATQPIGQP